MARSKTFQRMMSCCCHRVTMRGLWATSLVCSSNSHAAMTTTLANTDTENSTTSRVAAETPLNGCAAFDPISAGGIVKLSNVRWVNLGDPRSFNSGGILGLKGAPHELAILS